MQSLAALVRVWRPVLLVFGLLISLISRRSRVNHPAFPILVLFSMPLLPWW